MQFRGFPSIGRTRLFVFLLVSTVILLSSSLFVPLSATTSTDEDRFTVEAFEVLVDGRSIGFVRDEAIIDSFLSFSLEELGWELDDFRPLLSLRASTVTDNVFLLHQRLRSNLRAYLGSHRRGWVIRVGGGEPVALPTRRAVSHVLESLQQAYVPKPGPGEEIDRIEVRILDRITVRPEPVPAERIQEKDRAVRFLLRGTTEQKSYTVQSGDTAWDIARLHRMSLGEMERANPGRNLSRLYVGDELNLIVPKPFVHVDTSCRHLTRHRIPFRTRVRWDDSMYRTRAVVERRGVPGRKELTSEVRCLNGVEQQRAVLTETILAHPVTRIVRRGTLRTPDDRLVAAAFLPEGIGIITSPFGVRWGRFHAGIDIGVPVGTPVHAYRVGRVAFAGYRGRLGNLIILEHPGDLVTCYGHNSSILVKPGQVVAEGQIIARSGNSGYSTGPHVHFEVHESGKLRDPLVFLRENRR